MSSATNFAWFLRNNTDGVDETKTCKTRAMQLYLKITLHAFDKFMQNYTMYIVNENWNNNEQ